MELDEIVKEIDLLVMNADEDQASNLEYVFAQLSKSANAKAQSESMRKFHDIDGSEEYALLSRRILLFVAARVRG